MLLFVFQAFLIVLMIIELNCTDRTKATHNKSFRARAYTLYTHTETWRGIITRHELAHQKQGQEDMGKMTEPRAPHRKMRTERKTYGDDQLEDVDWRGKGK